VPMTTPEAGRPRSPATTEQVDAVMQAAHALAGITAQSVAEVEDRVTLPQLRVLILISEDASLNLSTLARALGVHPSNATRACDRLVAAGLLQRADSPADRRNLALALTDEGRQLVGTVTAGRRAAITAAIEQVPDSHRPGLITAMRSFATAAGDAALGSAWKLGWPC
jgi:DNA-binding MarR family transcriptional regulator